MVVTRKPDPYLKSRAVNSTPARSRYADRSQSQQGILVYRLVRTACERVSGRETKVAAIGIVCGMVLDRRS